VDKGPSTARTDSGTPCFALPAFADAVDADAAGIHEGLVRVSVGIEREADLLADVRRGPDAVA
jgi:cystathionine beta-lyase/cystathionine gamma-synthase